MGHSDLYERDITTWWSTTTITGRLAPKLADRQSIGKNSSLNESIGGFDGRLLAN
jgi:hypothetical protein